VASGAGRVYAGLGREHGQANTGLNEGLVAYWSFDDSTRRAVQI